MPDFGIGPYNRTNEFIIMVCRFRRDVNVGAYECSLGPSRCFGLHTIILFPWLLQGYLLPRHNRGNLCRHSKVVFGFGGWIGAKGSAVEDRPSSSLNQRTKMEYDYEQHLGVPTRTVKPDLQSLNMARINTNRTRINWCRYGANDGGLLARHILP